MHIAILSPTLRGGTLAVVIALVMWATALNAKATSEEEAHAIGVDAYLYFYSLVTMDLTRKQLTNVEPGKGFGGPTNTFANVPAYPTAEDRAVVRPNFDTLYSSAWLDLTKEPMVVSVPDTGGRYYLLPMLDMWTDVFASPGWRTTGTQAQTFVIAPLGWRPDLRDRLIDEFRLPKDTQRIDAPTPCNRPWWRQMSVGGPHASSNPNYERLRDEAKTPLRREEQKFRLYGAS